MSIFEYDEEKHLETVRAEGREEGRREGRREERKELLDLFRRLYLEGKMEDFEKALQNEDYRELMLEKVKDNEI